MIKYFENERGFTLIEMLLVLAIVAFIASNAMHFAVKNIDQNKTDNFFRQFQMDLHYLQSYAMANQVSVRLTFVNNGTEYAGILQDGDIILRKKMSEGYRASISNKYRLTYLANGNVSDFGVLTFYTPEGMRQLYIYIGKGRMRLDERIWN